MKQASFIILKNNIGQTTRVVPFLGENIEIVYRHDLRRIEFVSDLENLQEEGIEFSHLGQVAKNSEIGSTILKGTWGQVTHVQEVNNTANDVLEKKEDDKHDIFFFLRWTSAIQVASLILVLVIGYFLTKSEETPEPQVVQVFKRETIQEKTPVVAVTENKIKKVSRVDLFKRKSTKVAKKVVLRATGKTLGKNTRSGTELSRMGALSAFGGMNKSSTGLGGLSNKPSRSSGYGFDNNRARGGSDRGLLGKGLVQAGIGQGESMQGYGGYGDKGKGQGQAAYGSAGLAGRAGGYYLPLSEDATIEGGLDRDQVNAVVQRNFMQVRYCYESGLQTQSKLSGRVAVKFIISPNGDVSIANVAHTSLGSSKVESCIVGKVRGWRFPKPRGNVAVKVMYPFNLVRTGQG